MGGRGHYRKGWRFEREIVVALHEAGIDARRIPLSGAASGEKCDFVVSMLGRNYKVEAKFHGMSFKRLYEWLASVDLLIVRSNHNPALAVMPLDLAIDLICKAEGIERLSTMDEF